MVTIEVVKTADLRQTSELHRRYLFAGIFPRMGPRFLRCYHETFAASPHGVALVARDGGVIVGFLLGTVDNAAHYRWVISERGMALARCGVVALVVRPQVAWSFVTTRFGRYLRRLRRHLSWSDRMHEPMPTAGDAGGSPQVAILTHVATAEAARRGGVGRRLVEGFLAQARARGAVEARLITARDGPAAAFYAGAGWDPIADRRAHDGSEVREYRMVLSEMEAT